MGSRVVDGPDKAWLDIKEVAARLEVSKSTIERWMAEGTFYRPLKFSKGTHLWYWRQIVAWEMAREYEAYLVPSPTKGRGDQATPIEEGDPDG